LYVASGEDGFMLVESDLVVPEIILHSSTETMWHFTCYAVSAQPFEFITFAVLDMARALIYVLLRETLNQN
jgi:hypothetical protein